MTWTEIAVVSGVILVLLGILLPAVQRARDAARATQSKNNLKQLGLALHNYHDVYRCFPIGGDIEHGEVAKHGWLTRSIPFLESTPIYSWIDQDHAWDHPLNSWIFQRDMLTTRIPGASQSHSDDGLGLLHYMANPNVFHRNSSVALSDMTNGLQNSWLLGEADGDYAPWAYPFSWRELALPLNSRPGGFGRPTGDGAMFCLADGSVTKIANDVDPIKINKLATAPPVASQERIRKPTRKFRLAHSPCGNVSIALDGEPVDSRSRLTANILVDASAEPLQAHLEC